MPPNITVISQALPFAQDPVASWEGWIWALEWVGVPGHATYTVTQDSELRKSLMLCCHSLETLKNFIFELVFLQEKFVETMKPVRQQKRCVQ